MAQSLRSRARTSLALPLHFNALALMASTALFSVTGMVFWVIVARTQPASVVGTNGALIAAMSTIANVAQLSLVLALTAFLPARRNGAPRLVRNCYVLAVTSSVILATCVVVAAPHIGNSWSDLSRPALALAFLAAVPAYTLFNLQDGVLTALRRTVWVPVENGFYGLTKLVLAAAFLGVLGRFGPLLAWVLPAAIAVVPVTILIFRRLLPEHVAQPPVAGGEPGAGASFRRIAALETAIVLLAQLTVTTVPLIVVTIAGPTTGAKFYIPWVICQALDLVAVHVGSSITVEASHSPEAVSSIFHHMAIRVVPLVGLAALALGTVGPVLLRVFGSEYANGAPVVLRLLVAGTVCNSVTMLVISAARARREPLRILRIQAVAVMTVPVGVALLAAHFGASGAGLGWLVGNALTAVAAILHARRWFGLPKRSSRVVGVRPVTS